jgi:hypothetical protein
VYSNPRGSGGYGLILRGISTIGAQDRQVMSLNPSVKLLTHWWFLCRLLTAWIISHDNRLKQHVRNEVFMI